MRLRPPDLDELGLEASLRLMVAAWNAQWGTRTRFRLEVDGDLASVSSQEALNVYRIAQECLTNAARHGKPRHVHLRVEHVAANSEAVALSVEDDGGGDASQISAASGHGILGIRERIAALGGSLSIASGARGVRVAAIIPLILSQRESPATAVAA
jgi:signal transduction histidine kinase